MKKKTSDSIDIKHLANLAGLGISAQEKLRLTKQLKETIDYINLLNQLETKDIAPIFQVTELVNITREDIPGKSLKNVCPKRQGYFVTKRVKWGIKKLQG